MPSLKRKNDLIVWVYLSEIQQKIYEEFVSQDDVREVGISLREIDEELVSSDFNSLPRECPLGEWL